MSNASAICCAERSKQPLTTQDAPSGERVEGGEGLVHQQQARQAAGSRAMATRIFIPPESVCGYAQEPPRLTPRERDLLAALARAGDAGVVTQRHLLTRIRGVAQVEDTQYLPAYIAQLRQKLGDAVWLIRTEPGVEYRFGEERSGWPFAAACSAVGPTPIG